MCTIDTTRPFRTGYHYTESTGVSGAVVTLTLTGIKKTTMANTPFYLSMMFSDNVVYVSDGSKIFQSSDDGETWMHAFTITPDHEGEWWRCLQVVRVKISSHMQASTDFWTAEMDGNGPRRLRRYRVSLPLNGSSNIISSGNVALPSWLVACYIQQTPYKITYDGNSAIFIRLYDNSVHIWLVTGEYDRQLVTLPHNTVLCVAIDTAHHNLYAGQENGTLNIYALTYRTNYSDAYLTQELTVHNETSCVMSR